MHTSEEMRRHAPDHERRILLYSQSQICLSLRCVPQGVFFLVIVSEGHPSKSMGLFVRLFSMFGGLVATPRFLWPCMEPCR